MPKPFTQIFNQLRYGAAAQEANDHLIRAVAAVKALGRPATVTIKLTLNPPRRSSGVNYIEVVDDVSSKVPEAIKPNSIFFPTSDNGLSQMDERQHALPLDVAPLHGDESQGRTFEHGSEA